MAWDVEYTDEFGEWWTTLGEHAHTLIAARVEQLEASGPNLGRPAVGEIKTSAFDPQMKELRAGTIRILFIFNPLRTAILLLGGDKQGQWNRWYKTAIPAADNLYHTHLDELRQEGQL